MAQPDSASGLGPEGRRFESYYSDQYIAVAEWSNARDCKSLKPWVRISPAIPKLGSVVERSMALVLKTSVPKGTVSSNLTASAKHASLTQLVEFVRMYHERSIKFKLFPWIDQHGIKSKLTCGSRKKSLLVNTLCLLVQGHHGLVRGNHTHIYSRIVKWYNGRLISDYRKFNSCSGYQVMLGCRLEA